MADLSEVGLRHSEVDADMAQEIHGAGVEVVRA